MQPNLFELLELHEEVIGSGRHRQIAPSAP
jgi:hypothetical protein